jgi:methionine-rich copper-binding protein CopC
MNRSVPARRTAFVRIASVVALTIAAAATPSAAMHALALRHLKLLKSFPSADTTLTKSPDAVRLWLTEPTELPATKIQLTTEAGVAIPTASPTLGDAKDAPVVATIAKPLAAGAYKVSWKAMSKDGHLVKGTFAFKVASGK